MFGLFDGRMTLEQNEQLLLISESVKSGLPLADAIRLTASDTRCSDRPFLRFAKMLDEGVVPEEAAQKAGFPADIRDVFLQSLTSDQFADTFAVRSRLSFLQRKTIWQVVNSLIYPGFLILVTLLIFQFAICCIAPYFAAMFSDFDLELPALTNGVFVLARWSEHGGIILFGLIFCSVLYLLKKTIMPRFCYTIPLAGPVFHRQFQISLLRIIAFSMKRNIPFPDILAHCREITKNRSFRADLCRAEADSKSGSLIPEILARYPWLFPIWLPPFLFSCREPSEQAEVLDRGASILESQNRSALVTFESTSLILTFLFIVAFLGIIILGFLSPLIMLTESLSK